MNEDSLIYSVNNTKKPFRFIRNPFFLIIFVVAIVGILIAILSYLGVISIVQNSHLFSFISTGSGPHEVVMDGYRISAVSKVPGYDLRFDEGRLFTFLANFEVFDSRDKNLSTVERVEISLVPDGVSGGNARRSDENTYTIQSLQKYTTLLITIHINSNYIENYGLTAASDLLTEQVTVEALRSVRNIKTGSSLKPVEDEVKASLAKYRQVQIQLIKK